jgi:hypothetical protein
VCRRARLSAMVTTGISSAKTHSTHLTLTMDWGTEVPVTVTGTKIRRCLAPWGFNSPSRHQHQSRVGRGSEDNSAFVKGEQESSGQTAV